MKTTQEKSSRFSILDRGRQVIRQKLEKRIAKAVKKQAGNHYYHFAAYGENERDLMLAMGWEVFQAPTSGLTQAIRAPWQMRKHK